MTKSRHDWCPGWSMRPGMLYFATETTIEECHWLAEITAAALRKGVPDEIVFAVERADGTFFPGGAVN